MPKCIDYSYNVEKIVSKRKVVTKRAQSGKILKSKTMYLVKWCNWPHFMNTWQSKSDLNSPELIREFEHDAEKKKQSREANGPADLFSYLACITGNIFLLNKQAARDRIVFQNILVRK